MVSGSSPASHNEKCHRGAIGRGAVLANFTISTEMRHPPAVPLPTLKFGLGQHFQRLLSVSVMRFRNAAHSNFVLVRGSLCFQSSILKLPLQSDFVDAKAYKAYAFTLQLCLIAENILYSKVLCFHLMHLTL